VQLQAQIGNQGISALDRPRMGSALGSKGGLCRCPLILKAVWTCRALVPPHVLV